MSRHDNDNEKMIQNLKDAGCGQKILDNFALEWESGETGRVMTILTGHRCELLGQIHKYQKQLDCLDYLIYTMRKKGESYE